jgi:hypothetical protein
LIESLFIVLIVRNGSHFQLEIFLLLQQRRVGDDAFAFFNTNGKWLRKGILANTDLIRLIAYDHFGRQLVHTNFYISDDDVPQPFTIRIEKGKGIVSNTALLEEKEDFELKVRAISYDEDNKEALYQTSFIIFISVSAYTY